MSSEAIKTEAKPPSTPAGNPYAQLLALSQGWRPPYVAALACLAGSVAFSYVPAVIVAAALEVVLGQRGGSARWAADLLGWLGARPHEPRTLWLPAALILLAAAAGGTLFHFKGRLVAGACEGLIRALRIRLYDALQHLPLAFHDKNATGDLVQRCTSDVDTLRAFYANQVVEIARASLLMVTVVPVLFALDWRMALVALSLLPPIVGFSFFFFSRVKGRFKKADDAEGVMSAALQENLTGIRVVRAFHRAAFEVDRFDEKNRTHRDLNWSLLRIISLFWSSSDFLCFTQMLLVLAYGAYCVNIGRIGVGEFFFFITAVAMYLWPVREMGRTLTDMGKAVVSIGRVHEILSHAREPAPSTPAAQVPPRLTGAIDIRHLAFRHADKTILDDISLTIPPGATLALLGPSGSGKTTLISLLLRLYDYAEGSIRLDDIELSTLDRGFARSQFGTILQEPFLFSKTVRDNIRLGRHDATQPDVEEVARHAAVHEPIRGFENGYDTVVGERGVTLSGGQRQRVAIARALLRDAPIVILDDALSAVDTHTESIILDALRSRAGRHTTILIAHRLSTLMHADQIAVLEAGRITQLGTHDQLVAQDGLYRRLWDIQTALEEDLKLELEDATV